MPIARISVSDILRDTADLLTDEPLSSPVVELLEVWLSDPMTGIDPTHMAVAPSACERIGRHVAAMLQTVVEKHVLRAQQAAAEGRS